MRAAGLDDVVEFAPLRGERDAKRFERGEESVELRETRETNVGWNRVVRALRHVDVIVRMHRLVLAALSAEQLVRAIGEHLVYVHVVRRTGSGLIWIDDKLIHVLSVQHLVRRGDDRVREPGVETTGFLVRERRRFLDPDLCDHERSEWLEAADWEVLNRAERLHAIECVGGYVEGAEGIFFGTGGSGHESRRERARSAVIWSAECRVRRRSG